MIKTIFNVLLLALLFGVGFLAMRYSTLKEKWVFFKWTLFVLMCLSAAIAVAIFVSQL